MTAHGIVGLAAFNGALLVLGVAILWSLRGFARWGEVVRLCGLGYLLGVAAFGIAWTELLVLGVPLRGWTLVATLAVGFCVACAVGLALGRALPRRLSAATIFARTRPTTLVTAAGIALVGLVLEALFRVARLQGLQAYDAWAFWVPKAKAIYYFGGLDEELFTTLAGPTYPPLVPIVDAAAFHAIGSADTVTLHVQFWFLVIGGVAAIAGCLHGRVSPWLLWPPLLLALVVPRFGEHLLTPQADVLVDLLFVVAALLLALWLRDGQTWLALAATLLLAAATLTKREGVLFAAGALAICAVLSWNGRRTAWPLLGVSVAVVAAAAVPWRLWYRRHGIGGEAPPDAGTSGSFDRALDALRLSADVLFDTRLWSVIPILAVIAVAAGLIFGDRRVAAFFGMLLVLLFLGGAWVTYSFDLPITAHEDVNPIVRYTGATILLAAVATPLVLESVWRRSGKKVS